MRSHPKVHDILNSLCYSCTHCNNTTCTKEFRPPHSGQTFNVKRRNTCGNAGNKVISSSCSFLCEHAAVLWIFTVITPEAETQKILKRKTCFIDAVEKMQFDWNLFALHVDFIMNCLLLYCMCHLTFIFNQNFITSLKKTIHVYIKLVKMYIRE